MALFNAPEACSALMAALFGAKRVTFFADAREDAMLGYAWRMLPSPERLLVLPINAVRFWLPVFCAAVKANSVLTRAEVVSCMFVHVIEELDAC